MYAKLITFLTRITESMFLFFHRQYFKIYGDGNIHDLPDVVKYELAYAVTKNTPHQYEHTFHNFTVTNDTIYLEFVSSELLLPDFIAAMSKTDLHLNVFMIKGDKCFGIMRANKAKQLGPVTVVPHGDLIICSVTMKSKDIIFERDIHGTH